MKNYILNFNSFVNSNIFESTIVEGQNLYINSVPKIKDINKVKIHILEIFKKQKIEIKDFKVYDETSLDFLKKIASKNNNVICIGKIDGIYTYVIEY